MGSIGEGFAQGVQSGTANYYAGQTNSRNERQLAMQEELHTSAVKKAEADATIAGGKAAGYETMVNELNTLKQQVESGKQKATGKSIQLVLRDQAVEAAKGNTNATADAIKRIETSEEAMQQFGLKKGELRPLESTSKRDREAVKKQLVASGIPAEAFTADLMTDPILTEYIDGQHGVGWSGQVIEMNSLAMATGAMNGASQDNMDMYEAHNKKFLDSLPKVDKQGHLENDPAYEPDGVPQQNTPPPQEGDIVQRTPEEAEADKVASAQVKEQEMQARVEEVKALPVMAGSDMSPTEIAFAEIEIYRRARELAGLTPKSSKASHMSAEQAVTAEYVAGKITKEQFLKEIDQIKESPTKDTKDTLHQEFEKSSMYSDAVKKNDGKRLEGKGYSEAYGNWLAKTEGTGSDGEGDATASIFDFGERIKYRDKDFKVTDDMRKEASRLETSKGRKAYKKERGEMSKLKSAYEKSLDLQVKLEDPNLDIGWKPNIVASVEKFMTSDQFDSLSDTEKLAHIAKISANTQAGMILSDYMRSISGTAVAEAEATRLMNIFSSGSYSNKESFKAAISEFADGIRGTIRAGAKDYFIDTPLQSLELLQQTELGGANVADIYNPVVGNSFPADTKSANQEPYEVVSIEKEGDVTYTKDNFGVIRIVPTKDK